MKARIVSTYRACSARPTWLETNGDQLVPVAGYSLLDNVLALLAGLVVVGTAVAVLVVLP